MQTTNALLDRVKKAQGIESDYRLAQLLEVSRNAISSYRRGNSRPDDEVALRLAALIDRDPASVIAELHAERAKTPEVKAMWLRMASVMRHAVAAVMMTCGLAMLLIAGTPMNTEAASYSPAVALARGSVYYVKRLRRFGRFARSRLIRALAALRGRPVENEGSQIGNSRSVTMTAPCIAHPASYRPSLTC